MMGRLHDMQPHRIQDQRVGKTHRTYHERGGKCAGNQ
jgi:hypothetical protein